MRIIGCQGLHLAEVSKDMVGSVPTWGTPEPVPSLIAIDIEDNKDEVVFYSDDSIEEIINMMAGKTVTITLGHLSNELEAKITGNVYENGVFVQKGDATGSEFALMFKAPLSKNGGFQYVCLYKGVLSKNNANYKGKQDSVESSDIEISGTFMPLLSTGEVMIKVNSTDESAPTNLETKWFSAVPTKTTLASSSLQAKK